MNSRLIGVIDAGFGNVGSVTNALTHLEQSVLPIRDPVSLSTQNFDALVLPGVGSFHTAMQKLREAELEEALKVSAVEQTTTILGICLGAQLFFDFGTEGTRTNGLGLIRGSVRPLQTDSSRGMRVPHTGWNSVSLTEDWAKAMTTNSVDLYFNHGFVVEPENTSIVRAFCDYSERFVAGYQYQNIWGFRFHPEKSQKQGLRLLQYFLDST